MGRILSGVQPTGDLHLGNYLGAIRNWVPLQENNQSFFCIVDLHALTTLPDPQHLRKCIRETAAAYIACGIDPTKSAIFPQSAVPQHSELAWVFSCFTPLSWLNRMTQFKEKAGKKKEQANLGLYSYPVLQAADILVYKPTHVPVGDDQKQHLELTRDIAGAFNHHYGTEYFNLPEPLIMEKASRIMSLRDGSKKMSKSETSDFSRIHLLDTPDEIRLKIRKAKTDPEPIGVSIESMEGRNEAINLLSIYAALKNITPDAACQEFEGSTFAPFKEALTEILVETIHPIEQEMHRLLNDPASLDKVLRQGAEKAGIIAEKNMADIQEIIGLFQS